MKDTYEILYKLGYKPFDQKIPTYRHIDKKV